MKLCSRCRVEKPVDDFHNQAKSKDGKTPWCKDCMREYRVDWRTNNAERAKATDVAWRAANPAKLTAYRIKSTFNLSVEEYEALGSECWICGGEGPLVVDHDHSCCPGARSCGDCVRGVLCRKCNLALGHFDDDPVRLIRAVEYLEKTC